MLLKHWVWLFGTIRRDQDVETRNVKQQKLVIPVCVEKITTSCLYMVCVLSLRWDWCPLIVRPSVWYSSQHSQKRSFQIQVTQSQSVVPRSWSKENSVQLLPIAAFGLTEISIINSHQTTHLYPYHTLDDKRPSLWSHGFIQSVHHTMRFKQRSTWMCWL
jgi:hypothetical protein